MAGWRYTFLSTWQNADRDQQEFTTKQMRQILLYGLILGLLLNEARWAF